jgi:hypothetical protein
LRGVASVRWHSPRSARRVLIRGFRSGAAFYNGRARRILDRNAARQRGYAIRRTTQTRSERCTNLLRRESVSRLVASRARRIDTRRTFAFLVGWFHLASRVCNRTTEPGVLQPGRSGNARHNASIRLDQLNTFTNRRRLKRRNDWRLVRNRA